MISTYKIIAASIAASFCFCSSGFAIEAKVEGEKPQFDDLQSPEFSGGKNKPFKPKEWLEVEAKIKISISPEPKSKTAEDVVVKWYVAIKNPEKAGSYLLLTKEITHINVPLGEEIYSSVYLSPASIKRITGSDRGGKNAVEYVGFEVSVGGEVKLAETNKGKPGWWKLASDKISQSETVPLLSKIETPFANMWWDRYAEVKQDRK